MDYKKVTRALIARLLSARVIKLKDGDDFEREFKKIIDKGDTAEFMYTKKDGSRRKVKLEPASMFKMRGKWAVKGRDLDRKADRMYYLDMIGESEKESSPAAKPKSKPRSKPRPKKTKPKTIQLDRAPVDKLKRLIEGALQDGNNIEFDYLPIDYGKTIHREARPKSLKEGVYGSEMVSVEIGKRKQYAYTLYRIGTVHDRVIQIDGSKNIKAQIEKIISGGNITTFVYKEGDSEYRVIEKFIPISARNGIFKGYSFDDKEDMDIAYDRVATFDDLESPDAIKIVKPFMITNDNLVKQCEKIIAARGHFGSPEEAQKMAIELKRGRKLAFSYEKYIVKTDWGIVSGESKLYKQSGSEYKDKLLYYVDSQGIRIKVIMPIVLKKGKSWSEIQEFKMEERGYSRTMTWKQREQTIGEGMRKKDYEDMMTDHWYIVPHKTKVVWKRS